MLTVLLKRCPSKVGIRTRRDGISLPALLFFRSYNEVFAQTAFIPYYLRTDIDFVCVLCTSSSTAAVASLSLPLTLCIFSRVPHTTISPFLYLPFCFFAATTKCLYKGHLFPISLLARNICRFVTTGLILCKPLYATN